MLCTVKCPIIRLQRHNPLRVISHPSSNSSTNDVDRTVCDGPIPQGRADSGVLTSPLYRKAVANVEYQPQYRDLPDIMLARPREQSIIPPLCGLGSAVFLLSSLKNFCWVLFANIPASRNYAKIVAKNEIL